MKRIALLCCLIAVFGTGNASIIIKASLNFGSRQKDCHAGFGICLLSESEKSIPQNQVELRLSDDKAQLEICFPQSLVEAYPEAFREDVFIQDEDYELPVELQRQLGLGPVVVIPAGKFAVRQSEGFRAITIPLR